MYLAKSFLLACILYSSFVPSVFAGFDKHSTDELQDMMHYANLSYYGCLLLETEKKTEGLSPEQVEENWAPIANASLKKCSVNYQSAIDVSDAYFDRFLSGEPNITAKIGYALGMKYYLTFVSRSLR